MKLRVERDDLVDAVGWTARTLPSRPTVPVLAGLLLATDDSGDQPGLSVSGFDFEVAAQSRVPVTVAEPGRVLVSGRLLAEIVRALPSAPVELSADGARVTLTCGTSRFALPLLPVEDYPQLPELPPLAGRLESSLLAAAVAQVAIAAGHDDTLPVLTGVRVEIDGEQLTLAATDRYRLAVRELRWRPEQDDDAPRAALVPARTLLDTAKQLGGAGAEVELRLGDADQGEGMAGFRCGHLQTTTRLLDGEFPRYRSLLPSTHDTVAEVSTAALADAVKRVRLVAARTAPIRLSFAGEEVLLEAGSGDDATASERLPGTTEGPDITIAFNPGYLLDGLQAMDADICQLSFTTSARPAVLTGKTADGASAPGAGYRYLLMPVRLPG